MNHSPQTRRSRAYRGAVGFLTLLAAAAAFVTMPLRAAAQDIGPDKPDSPFNHGVFRFAAQARGELRQLWSTSIDAKEERVACLGGYVRDSVVYVTRVSLLEPTRADSANISALESLRQCGPPQWMGTVHTHIARFDGQPYIIFSANDRRVMDLWRHQYRREGVFCILFSEVEANCEAGVALSAEATYSYARGNNIVF
jgi:hypothetical protein